MIDLTYSSSPPRLRECPLPARIKPNAPVCYRACRQRRGAAPTQRSEREREGRLEVSTDFQKVKRLCWISHVLNILANCVRISMSLALLLD